MATTVVGGTVSVIGGGKFANGAAQAAFGYLFNAAVSENYEQGKSAESKHEDWLRVQKELNPNFKYVSQVKMSIPGVPGYQIADFVVRSGANTEIVIRDVKTGGAILSTDQVRVMAEAVKSGNVQIHSKAKAKELGILHKVSLRDQRLMPMISVIGGNSSAVMQQLQRSGIPINNNPRVSIVRGGGPL